MSRNQRIITGIVTIAVFAAFSIPFLPWIPDDAYISFVYARNLAEGAGLSFNVGERVEGFSNLLWTLVLAIVHRMGGRIEALAPLLSLGAAFASLFLLLAFARETLEKAVDADRRHTSFFLFCIAMMSSTFFPFVFYASSGLETSAYLLCLLSGAFCHLYAIRTRAALFVSLASMAFLAAALLRPEGIGFLILNSAFLFLWTPRFSRSASVSVALALAAFLAVLLWRYDYFGDWVPNTYFAKPGAAWGYFHPTLRGAEYLTQFFTKSGLVALLPFALICPRRLRSAYEWSYLWSFVLYQLAFIVFVGGDVLRFDRFTVPLFPWLFVLAGMGFLNIMSGPEHQRRLLARRAIVLASTLVVLLNVARTLTAHTKACPHDWMMGRVQREVGELLGELLPAKSTVATNEVGAIKYYSRLQVIDMLGLTDDTISAIRYHSFRTYGIGSSRWSAVSVASYIMGREPEAVLLPATEEISLSVARDSYRATMHPLWYAIFTDPDFVGRYSPILGLRIHPAKYLYLFVADGVELRDPSIPTPNWKCLDIWHITDR